MPFCERCGKEINEGDRFCPHCGAPIGRYISEYRRPREGGWTAGRIIIVVIGFIILLVSFGLLAGGAGLMFARRNLSDEGGFLMIRPADLRVDSHAIVGKGIDIELDPASSVWIRRLGDFVTLKLVVSGNDPSKEVFVGLAREADASGYLSGMWYHEVDDLRWSYGSWSETPPEIGYTVHLGESPVAPPTVFSWWVVHSSGPGALELEWEPEVGRYLVIVMNSDGSAEVDVSISIGARVPLLRTIENVLLAGGFIALVTGGVLIYLGIIRRS